MITNPTQQRNLRGHMAARPTPRAASSAEHQARLAARLTPRDKWIARMVHEHRVLTAHQITTLCFPSSRSARERLRELFTWNVLDRFQPFIHVGSSPMHYVLAPAGAAVLAGEDGLDVKSFGYRPERAFADWLARWTTWNGSTGTAPGSSSAAAVLNLVNPSIATTSLPADQADADRIQLVPDLAASRDVFEWRYDEI